LEIDTSGRWGRIAVTKARFNTRGFQVAQKITAIAFAMVALAGCGSTSASHSSSTVPSSVTSSRTTTTSGPQIDTAKLSACVQIAQDLQTIGSDLRAMQTAMKRNGDIVGAATKLTQDVDTAKPDIAKLRTLVPSDQQPIVDEEANVFSQYAMAAQQAGAQDLQGALESLISANGAQQSFNQQLGKVCKLTK
jgi:hypothetical protein